LNSEEGTDYEVFPSNEEPADVRFVSPSGQFPDRMVQVVTIPHDYEVRADNRNVERLKRDLEQALEDRNVQYLTVGLTLLGETPKRGVPKEQVDNLADLISAAHEEDSPEPIRQFGWAHLLARDPALTGYVATVVLFEDETNQRATVDTPGVATQLPDDGSWIEDGMQLKLKKYGGKEAVKDLTLVIGVEALVDRQQVDAYLQTHTTEEIPFHEVWINSVEGTIRLK
jgi:hypothetical protein